MSKWTPPPKMTTDEHAVRKPPWRLTNKEAAIFYERCLKCGRSITEAQMKETVRLYWEPRCDDCVPK